ncbi:hypothetical protein J2T13_000134 [Paenibacillus sp. DS2015]|uniref:tail fiber protein n=1 Tax=Paenibacillus sp. DS2015 TaxID=3373917 RepID=UPI003D20C67F
MANTVNLNLPLIDDNMVADVPRDINALAQAVDSAVVAAIADVSVPLVDAVSSTSVTMAPTANALKTVNDSVVAHKADYIKHILDGTSHVYYADDTGTANAKVVVISAAVATLKKGLGISFTNNVLNTGAVTINVNGLGVKAVLKSNGLAMVSGNLKANSVYTLRYNGTSFILQGEGGEYGTAIATDVLAGKTLGTDAGIISGTMVNNGAVTITPKEAVQVIPKGYHDGNGNVASGYTITNSTITVPSNSYLDVFPASGKTRIISASFYNTGRATNLGYSVVTEFTRRAADVNYGIISSHSYERVTFYSGTDGAQTYNYSMISN